MTSLKSSLFLIITVQLTFFDSNGQVSKKFFRKDYTYLDKSESFYKVHTIHRTWLDAKNRCAMEGASLWYPENQEEVDTVIEFWNQTQYYHWVYVGISDSIAKGVFETIDGRPVIDVYNVWAPGEPNDAGGEEGCVILRRDGFMNDDRCDRKFPFICKKSLDSLEWNSNCDMPNPEYVYNEPLGRCYKFHLDTRNWTEAVARCSAENSYLAVINSEEEAKYLIDLTDKAPKDKVTGSYLRGAVHLGFHNRDGDGWRTIKGTTIDDSGYSNWAYQQPDGGDNERCGTMFYNGQLNDINCDTRCFYICEHDIGTLTDTFNERFGE